MSPEDIKLVWNAKYDRSLIREYAPLDAEYTARLFALVQPPPRALPTRIASAVRAAARAFRQEYRR